MREKGNEEQEVVDLWQKFETNGDLNSLFMFNNGAVTL